jgi:exonuclease SbcC
VIKRIELKNFMSHEHSVFELTEGLNVLVGPNNCGKTAVVTALQILCYNDNSTYVLRHEARECSIQVETVEGHVVRWARKKGGSPYYEINDQRFDRLGKNNVPERLHEVLRLPRVQSDKDRFDVHFGEQRSPVFLLNEKPRQAADFFASSSDARLLLEMQSRQKTRVRDAQSRQKSLQREAAELVAALDHLEPLDGIETRLQSVEQQWRDLQDDDARRMHLRNLIEAVSERQHIRETLDAKLRPLGNLPKPPQLADTQRLAELLDTLATRREQLTNQRRQEMVLGKLTEPPILSDPAPLESLLARRIACEQERQRIRQKLKTLRILMSPPQAVDESRPRQLLQDMQKHINERRRLSERLAANHQQLQQIRQQLQAWTRAHPHCPVCGGAVTVEQLIAEGASRGCQP